MNILVTGAAGFIGSHFIDVMLQHNLVVIDKLSYAASRDNIKNLCLNEIPLYTNSIEDTNQVTKAIIENNIEVVVNFAAETHVDNSIKDCRPFVKSNVDGVLSLLEACKLTRTKLIHISTDEVYGPAGDLPFHENDKLSPQNPYAATKAASEHLIVSYANTFNLEYLIIRPTNNFGPRQNLEKFIPKYIKSVIENKKFPLYGDGTQIREWFFVKDCVNVISELVKSHNNLRHNVYNIGSPGTSMKNIDVCKKIHSIISGNSSFEETITFVQDRPGHDKKYAINIDRMISEVGHSISWTSFESGVLETIEYYKNEK